MISPRPFLSFALFLQLLLGSVAERAPAQCATQWLPGNGFPGTNGEVIATTLWDPDGPGPLQPVLVIGGRFSVAGTIAANNIAIWDPGSGLWSALGSGMNNTVNALTTLPNGDLIAGGLFTTAGGTSANYIARWNGTSWSALSSGLSSMVRAVVALPNGDLVAGGVFSAAGGGSANRIARWDGTSWSALGSGMDVLVNALAVLPNGDLVAGGVFFTAGGTSASRIA